TEPTFQSDIPILGTLIVGFRQLWHSVSAKWAVRQLMQQQTAFNRLATRLLNELHHQGNVGSQEIGVLFVELLKLQQQQESFAAQTAEDFNDLRQQLAYVESLLGQLTGGEEAP
ncbi:MAG: hypothetical protein GY943_33995, partial [Chloroflexi bacterium]|nr:hypothetical protein [Chloroflexota bacterium]